VEKESIKLQITQKWGQNKTVTKNMKKSLDERHITADGKLRHFNTYRGLCQ
jgi:hypothetical protein